MTSDHAHEVHTLARESRCLTTDRPTFFEAQCANRSSARPSRISIRSDRGHSPQLRDRSDESLSPDLLLPEPQNTAGGIGPGA